MTSRPSKRQEMYCLDLRFTSGPFPFLHKRKPRWQKAALSAERALDPFRSTSAYQRRGCRWTALKWVPTSATCRIYSYTRVHQKNVFQRSPGTYPSISGSGIRFRTHEQVSSLTAALPQARELLIWQSSLGWDWRPAEASGRYCCQKEKPTGPHRSAEQRRNERRTNGAEKRCKGRRE